LYAMKRGRCVRNPRPPCSFRPPTSAVSAYVRELGRKNGRKRSGPVYAERESIVPAIRDDRKGEADNKYCASACKTSIRMLPKGAKGCKYGGVIWRQGWRLLFLLASHSSISLSSAMHDQISRT
jgi:hypothetical protein